VAEKARKSNRNSNMYQHFNNTFISGYLKHPQ